MPSRNAENARGSSTFRDDARREQPGQTVSSATAQPRALYRSGTEQFDPFWHGPRLKPAFVAQLLGQVLARDQSELGRSAYRGATQVGTRLDRSA